jgi:hypothetical protein
MPYRFYVPGCKSNYKSSSEKCSVFSFPKEPDRVSLWLRKINRADYTVTKTSRICEKHFDERFITIGKIN